MLTKKGFCEVSVDLGQEIARSMAVMRQQYNDLVYKYERACKCAELLEDVVSKSNAGEDGYEIPREVQAKLDVALLEMSL